MPGEMHHRSTHVASVAIKLSLANNGITAKEVHDEVKRTMEDPVVEDTTYTVLRQLCASNMLEKHHDSPGGPVVYKRSRLLRKFRRGADFTTPDK